MSPVNFDIDTFNEEIQNAPRVGFGPRSTFGKLTIADIQIAAFERSNGRVEAKFRPYTGKDKPDRDKGEYFQTTFAIDIQELSTQAQDNDWKWERRVDVKLSSADGKVQTDWDFYVLPSLVNVIGKDWMKKLQKGVYVEVLEPETVEVYAKSNPEKGYKKGDKRGWTDNEGTWRVNTTFQVVRMFANKKECEAARNEKYAAREETSSDSAPDGKSKKIPAKVITDVVGILNVYDGDTTNEDFLALLQSEYSQYPMDELISIAEKAANK